MTDYRIEWDGEAHPELEQRLKDDLASYDINVEHLVTHTMMVDGGGYDSGPSVGATWDRKKGCVVATYYAETKWVSLRNDD